MRARPVQAVVVLLPLLAVARGIDLLSLVVLLGLAAWIGVRRDAAWTDAVGRAIDLSLVGLLGIAVLLLTVPVVPRSLHEALTVTLAGAWVLAAVVTAGLAITTADQPRWRPLLRRVLDARAPG